MKIEGSSTIPVSREKVWALLLDPAVIQRTVPGCEELKPEGEGVFRAKVRAGIATIRGNVEGEIRLENVRAPEHYRMVFSGKGMGSFLNGHADMDLGESAGATEVRYSGEVSVGGMIAAVGNRMIELAARKAIGDFFERIKQEAAAP